MTDIQEKVSIVVPTYNRAKLLAEAVGSLQQQTYKNIEIIIVDDCSTDDTTQAVEKMQDGRIVYVKHEVNKGGGEARNTGIAHATGAYIGFLDSDDQWQKDKLERQMAVFRENPDVGVVYTGMKVYQGNYLVKEVIPKYSGDLLTKLIESNCIYTTSSILVKKEVLEEAGGFDSSLPSCQDWDLYIRLARISRFGFVEDSLVLYHLHPGERISTNSEAVIDGHMKIYHGYKELAKAQGKDTFQKFSIKIAKTIFRVGMLRQDKETINLARRILVEGLAKTESTSKNLLLYFSTFINRKFLLFLYKQFEKINTGNYPVPGKRKLIFK
ncbi:MAG TPA: glycosyltransferase family A protein [Planococcus sp. (in: firmicutes)]|nr:glycosyltransferase family A protein [Planococcus sp. (in: firmicutes)]